MKTYEQGYNDGRKYSEKNSISIDSVTESFDKFLDKINKLKLLLKESKEYIEENSKSKAKKEEILNKINSELNCKEEIK